MTDNFRNKYQRERDFKMKFESTYPMFEYLSGYVNGQSKVSIRCKSCGTILSKAAVCVRTKANIRCDTCVSIETQRKHDEKKRQYDEYAVVRRQRMDAKKSATRQREHEYNSRMWKKIQDQKPTLTIKCKACSKEFTTKNHNLTYCSKSCSMKDESYRYSTLRNRRIKENGLIDKDISLEALVLKDLSICHICNKKVDPNDCHYKSNGVFISGRNYPSVDHVIAVANGGTHTWNNVRLAHKHCNSMKSDKGMIETKHGQFSMIL